MGEFSPTTCRHICLTPIVAARSFNNDGQRPTGEAHMLQAGVVEVEGDMRTTGRLFHEVEL